MSNPYTSGFAPPSRSAWIKATRWWLKRHAGLTTRDLAAMTGLQGNSLAVLSNHQKAPVWLCELLAALVAGWRPSVDWPTDYVARLEMMTRVAFAPPEVQAFLWNSNPVAPVTWEKAIWDGTANNVPPRWALVAEAALDRAIPCGLPFGDWTP